MFCEKKDKYKKSSKNRENLTQARQLRTDITVRNSAELKMDSHVLALLSRELTAAEAHYHCSCYRQYTKVTSTSAEVSKQNENTIDEPYINADAAALVKLFNYIRNDIFVNKSIRELSKLNERLKAFMLDSGIEELKPSTSKHLRRTLENEFKDTLHMIQTESSKVVVYPDNLTRDELALICFNLERHCPREVSVIEVARMATKVHQSVKDHFSDQQEWPPNVSSLLAGSTEVPEIIDTFLHLLFSGTDSPLTVRMTWLKRSVAQHLVFAITRCRFKAVKSLLTLTLNPN